MSEWLPMSTAPVGDPNRNGPRILAWWPQFTPDIDYWTDGCQIAWWKWNRRINRGYFSYTDEMDDYEIADNQPTHWMPLPAGPE